MASRPEVAFWGALIPPIEVVSPNRTKRMNERSFSFLARVVTFPRGGLFWLILFAWSLCPLAGHAEDSKDETAALNQQVVQLYQQGKFAEAIPIATKVLELREKALGPEHPGTARSLGNLAGLYQAMGDYARAEPLYQRALKIWEKALGPEHPDTATSLNYLAALYLVIGDYAKAEPLYQRALKIREKALGPEHPDTATSLNNLAALYDSMGDYARAEPLLQQILRINEKTVGKEDQITAAILSKLGVLYTAMGDYAKAEPLLQRSLKIKEKVLGPDDMRTGGSLNDLAILFIEIGDYAKAESLLKRSLRISEKACGPEDRSTANSLSTLATLYHKMRNYAKAEPLHQQALKINEKVLGPEHSDTANCLNNFASCYFEMGNHAEAEPLYERALKIREKTLGPEHPSTAISLNNLAALYHMMGNYTKAELLFQRALKIDEKALGPDHPGTASDLSNLAFVCLVNGKRSEALDLIRRNQKAELVALANILSFTSEQQRLAYQKIQNPYTLFATIGSGPEIALTILRNKGVVLDSLLEDRLVAEASADPKQREKVDQVRQAKQRLMQLVMQVPKDFTDEARQRREMERERLSKQVEEMEAALARQVAGLGRARRALSVTTEQVQAAIPQNTVLVELLRYNHYLGKNKWEVRYGAVIICRAGASPSVPQPSPQPDGNVAWASLGAAEAIEKNIKLYQKSVRGKTDETTLSTVLQALGQQVWEPIAKVLPAGTKTVIISPDGELNFVSFATLLTKDDQFLDQKYSIRYVASGRDLLREPPAKPPARTLTVYANPEFQRRDEGGRMKDEGTSVAMREIEQRDFRDIRLSPLPGTEKEARSLQANSAALGLKETVIRLGPQATEADLNAVRSPFILHLATHGFFLPEIEMEGPAKGLRFKSEIGNQSAIRTSNSTILKNPMHRSGLALAGAQTTLQAWARGETPPTDNDGIVTAEEVGGLKLNETWLVVLSACETGTGEAKAGEGVMGLRRGFIQAGTQNLLMTLWPIADEETARFMIEFYTAAHHPSQGDPTREKAGNAPEALDGIQRDWLVRLRKEKGLLYAVNRAGPFILSFTGKP